MINFTREGCYMKIGLNLYFCNGGFVASWVWYHLAEHNVSVRRFRLRLHMKPRFIWSHGSHNVIENYMQTHNVEIVHREVLADLKAIEQATWRRTEKQAWIQPGKR
jgi:hypothetical protein